MVVSLLKCPFSKDDRCPNFDHSREDYDRDKHMAAPSLNRSKDVGDFHLKTKKPFLARLRSGISKQMSTVWNVLSYFKFI